MYAQNLPSIDMSLLFCCFIKSVDSCKLYTYIVETYFDAKC